MDDDSLVSPLDRSIDDYYKSEQPRQTQASNEPPILIDEYGDEYVIVGGRRFVLDDDEPAVPLDKLNVDDSVRTSIPEPPRYLSLGARFAAFFRATPSSMFGWVWLCAINLIVLFLVSQIQLGGILPDLVGSWEPFGEATIVSCKACNFQVNGVAPYVWEFKGKSPDDSSDFVGVSYAKEHCIVGSTVQVERWSLSNTILRVKGTSLVKGGGASVFVFFLVIGVFGGVGVCLAWIGPYRSSRRTLKALQFGKLTEAAIAGVKDTGARVNNTPVSAVSFKFKTESGEQRETSVKTLDPETYTKHKSRPLLYLPEDVKSVVVLDPLPKGLQLDSYRHGFRAKLSCMIMPTIVVAIFVAELCAAAYFIFQIDRAVFSVSSTEEPPAAVDVET